MKSTERFINPLLPPPQNGTPEGIKVQDMYETFSGALCPGGVSAQKKPPVIEIHPDEQEDAIKPVVGKRMSKPATHLKQQQRSEQRIRKAVVEFTPYVLKSLTSRESAWLDTTGTDPIKEAVRRLFYGLKGKKNEQVRKINRLTKQETTIAVARVIRNCLEQPEIVELLAAKSKERKVVIEKEKKTVNYWAEDADRKLRSKRLRLFRPLAPPRLTARARRAR